MSRGISGREWHQEGMRYGYLCDTCGVFSQDYDAAERHVHLYHKGGYVTDISYRRVKTYRVSVLDTSQKGVVRLKTESEKS